MTAPSNLIDTNVQDIIAANPMPTSFNNDAVLFFANLAGMTAFACMASLVAGWMLLSIIRHYRIDGIRDPITIYRAKFFCASAGLAIRTGGGAAALWAWDSRAAKTGAAVLAVQRYLDLVSLMFAGGWLVLLALSYNAMSVQLRKVPYPVKMMAQIHSLKAPAGVVFLCIAAAAGITWFRSQAGLP